MKTFLSLLSILLIGAVNLTAAETKSVLILVTSADKMTSGKPTGLWLEEFAVPYLALIKAGYKIEVTTPKGGAAPIDDRSKPTPEQEKAWTEAAKRLKNTTPVSKVNADKFAAIFIPGGHGVMFDLVSDESSIKLIEAFERQGKPIASVCHGPAALVKVKRADGTSIVAGKKVTAFTDAEERSLKLENEMPFLLESRLRELGAKVEVSENFTPHAVRDGLLVTGQSPPSSDATVKLLIEALNDVKAKGK